MSDDDIEPYRTAEQNEPSDVRRINGHVIECHNTSALTVSYRWNCHNCGAWYTSVRNFKLNECDPDSGLVTPKTSRSEADE